MLIPEVEGFPLHELFRASDSFLKLAGFIQLNIDSPEGGVGVQGSH